jgi:hypothetical protein
MDAIQIFLQFILQEPLALIAIVVGVSYFFGKVVMRDSFLNDHETTIIANGFIFLLLGVIFPVTAIFTFQIINQMYYLTLPFQLISLSVLSTITMFYVKIGKTKYTGIFSFMLLLIAVLMIRSLSSVLGLLILIPIFTWIIIIIFGKILGAKEGIQLGMIVIGSFNSLIGLSLIYTISGEVVIPIILGVIIFIVGLYYSIATFGTMTNNGGKNGIWSIVFTEEEVLVGELKKIGGDFISIVQKGQKNKVTMISKNHIRAIIRDQTDDEK